MSSFTLHRVVGLRAQAKQARQQTFWLEIEATDDRGEEHDITFFMSDFELARRIADNFNAAVVATGPLEVS